MKKKILILGSHSFSGSSLVEKLLEKNKLDLILIYNNKKKNFFLPFNQQHKHIVINKKIDLLKDIIGLKKIIKKTKPSYIVDFASNCNVNLSWIKTEEINQINYLNKIDLVKFLSKKII